MKNKEQTAARNIPQLPEVRRTENNRPVKVLGTQNSEDRAHDFQDKVILSSNIPQLPVTYGNDQIKPVPDIQLSKPISTKIALPENYSYLNSNIIETSAQQYPADISLESFKEVITFCDNLDEITDILKWSERQGTKSLVEFMDAIVSICPLSKIQNCDYLTKHLNFKISPNGGDTGAGKILNIPFFSITVGGKSQIVHYQKSSSKNAPSLVESFSGKFRSKFLIGAFAVRSNNITQVDQAFKYILNNIDKCLEQTKRDQNIHRQAIYDFYSVIDFLTPDYQNRFISKYRQFLTKIPSIASAVSENLLQNKAYGLTIEVLKDSMPTFEKESDWHRHMAYCENNIAVALFRLGKFAEAFPHAQNAYNYLPSNYDFLHHVIYLAKYIGQYQVANEIITTVTKPDLKRLLEISMDVPCLNIKKNRELIKKMSNNIDRIPKQFHEALYVLHFNVDQIGKRGQSSKIDSTQFKIDIIKFREQRNIKLEAVINICLYFNENDLAQDLLNKVNIEVINDNLFLQRCRVMLQTGGNRKLVQEIVDYKVNDETKADLHFSAASSCIVAENFESANEHLQAAIDAQPENEEYKQVSFLAAVLTDDQAQIKSSFNKLDTETQAELFSTFTHEAATTESTTELTSATSTTVGTNYSEVEFDHQKIHAHFQSIKAQRLNELSSFSNSSSGWKVGDANIPTSKAVPLGTHNGLTYYGYIADKFQGAENAAFKTALEKGFTKRAEGVNGVKAFKGVFEIKIDGDARLYTYKVYKNEQGQLLLFFDRYGNHDAVELFARNNKRIEILA